MSDRYIIQWRSKVNGRIGKGSKVFSRDEAAQLVRELNLDYPEIEHEPVPADEPMDELPGPVLQVASGNMEN